MHEPFFPMRGRKSIDLAIRINYMTHIMYEGIFISIFIDSPGESGGVG